MLKVGITGGIGTGKSFVCGIFSLLGIPVYDADQRAKELVEELPSLRSQIIDLFGKEAYIKDEKYNRKFISAQIFERPELKKKLEDIIHPEVITDSIKWYKMQQKKKSPYAIKEAALLFESGSYQELDKIIVVDAPLNLRIQRIVHRDQLTEQEIQRRIDNQWTQSVKIAKADFVIMNDGNSPVIPQVLLIHHQLIKVTSLSL